MPDSNAGFFPSPHQAILGVNDLAHSLETALGQDSCRGVCFGQGMGANRAYLAAAKGVLGQGLGSFRRVTFTLMLRVDTISNLHHAAVVRRTFESSSADDLLVRTVYHQESMNPRIEWSGRFQPGHPSRGNVHFLIRWQMCELSTDFLPRLGNQFQVRRENGSAQSRNQFSAVNTQSNASLLI